MTHCKSSKPTDKDTGTHAINAAANQNLSAAPAYFYGPACFAQGLAQAVGGTLTHVQLLIDGKVLLDQTPTGQSSVPVGATFDSLPTRR
jgi:hypothetical protein